MELILYNKNYSFMKKIINLEEKKSIQEYYNLITELSILIYYQTIFI
jgi:hypothetical protein